MILHIKKSFGLFVALLSVSIMLQSCNETIDARQIQNINGLIYKLNATEPFTGTVVNYKEWDEFSKYEQWNCEIHFKKGELHGSFNCVSSKTGVKTGEKTYEHNFKTGLETIWSNEGNLISKTEWIGGRRNGLQEVYHAKNGILLEKRHWLNNAKLDEKVWDASGTVLLADLQWWDGKMTGYTKNKEIEENYKDGVRHGYQKIYHLTMEGIDEDLAASRETMYVARAGYYFYGMFKGAFVLEETLYDNGSMVSSQSYKGPHTDSATQLETPSVENEKNTDFN